MKTTLKKISLICLCFLLFAIGKIHAQSLVTVEWLGTNTNTNTTGSITIPSTISSANATVIGGGGGGGGGKAQGWNNAVGSTVCGAAGGGGGQGCTQTGTVSGTIPIVAGKRGLGGSAAAIACGNTTVTDNKTSGDGGQSSAGSIIANGGIGAYNIKTWSSGSWGSGNGCNAAYYDQGGRHSDGGAAGCALASAGSPGSMDNEAWNCIAPTNVRGGKGGGASGTYGSDEATGGDVKYGYEANEPGVGGGGGASRSNRSNFCENASGGTGGPGKVIITFTLPAPAFSVANACVSQTMTFTITNFNQTDYNAGRLAYSFTADGAPTTMNNFTIVNANTATFTVTAPATTGSVAFVLASTYTILQSGGTVTGNTTTSATQNITINNVPQITAFGNQTVCVGTSLNLTPAITNNGIAPNSWTWKLNDTTIDSDNTLSYTNWAYPTDNGGTLTYQVANSCGSSNIVSVVLTVRDKPTVSITTPSVVCVGQPINITPSITENGSAITAYSWMLSGTEIGTDVGLSYTPTITDNGKSLTLIATNACGSTTSNAIAISVNPLPDIIQNNRDVCSGEAFSFTAASFGTDISTMSWTTPTLNSCSGSPGAESDQSTFAGTLTSSLSNDNATAVYVFTAKSAAGCTSTENVTVRVNCVPEINANVYAPAICSGESLSFKPQDGTDGILTSSTEYKWVVINNPAITINTVENTWAGVTAGIGNPITATNIVNTSDVPQTQLFTVTYRRSSACSGTEKTFTLSLVVNPTPSFTVIHPAAICAPNTVDIFSTISALAPASSTLKYYTSYTAPNLGGEFFNTTTSTSGTYWIQATSTEGCKSEPKSVTITIKAQPVISGNVAICKGSTASFHGDIAGGAWSVLPADVASIDTSTGEVTGLKAGNATITYIVDACSNTYDVTINDLPEITNTADTTVCADGTASNITISATASAGAVVDWYETDISTTSIHTGNNYVIPTLTSTSSYYVQARNTTTTCVSSPRVEITATLLQSETPPEERWGGYNSVCPIDQSNAPEDHDEIYVWIDTVTNIKHNEIIANTQPSGCTDCVPDVTNHTENYFANYIKWDYLATNGVDEDAPDFYTNNALFNNINWYHFDGSDYILIKSNGVLTAEGEALQAAGKFLPFWQNLPHATETYYAAIAASNATHCESAMKEITVYITEDEVNLPNICYSTYTRQTGTSMLTTISWKNVFKTHYAFDSVNQGLYWFDDEATARDAYVDYNAGTAIIGNINPVNVDLTTTMATVSLWVFRYETAGCATAPLEVSVSVYEHPYINAKIKANGLTKDTICVGENTVIIIGLRPIPASGEIKYYHIFSGNGNDYDVCSDTLAPIEGIENAYQLVLSTNALNLGDNSISILKLWDEHSDDPCFEMESTDDFQLQTIIIMVTDKPTVGNITAPTIVCAGNALSLTTPNINDNYNAITDEGWEIELIDAVWTSFDPSTDMNYATHNDKRLRYFATNECGTATSDTVKIAVSDRPEFLEPLTDFWSWSPVCEGTEFNIEDSVNHFILTDYKGIPRQDSWWKIATTVGGSDPHTLSYDTLPRPYTATLADDGKWIALIARNGCGTDTVFAQLGVTAKPVLHSIKHSVCSGSPIVLTPQDGVNGDIVPAGTTFAWDRASIPANISGTTNTYHTGGSSVEWQTDFVQTLTNSADTAIRMVYYLYANNNGCPAVPVAVNDTVIVNPKPALANKSSSICSGETFTMTAETNDIVPVGTTYTWTVATNTNVSGQSDVSVASTSVSQTLNNSSASDQIVVYTVTPTSGSCIGTSFTVSITVHPVPKAEIFSTEICQDDSITIVFTGTANFTLEYSITQTGVATFTPAELGLPTTFGPGELGSIWNNTTHTATFPFTTAGEFTLNFSKITDGSGCESVE